MNLCIYKSAYLQVILFKQKPPQELSFHSSIEIEGTLVESTAPGQKLEFQASSCKVINYQYINNNSMSNNPVICSLGFNIFKVNKILCTLYYS